MLQRAFKTLWGRIHVHLALMTARSTSLKNLVKPIRTVLVVCYGNIYRSAFLGAYLADRSTGRFEVRSSGLHKKVDRPSPERHIAMSRAAGVDLSRHRSSRLTSVDVDWADIIVVMDRHNWHALWALRTPKQKIVWAGALTKGDVEIPDPYQMSDEAAMATIGRLREAGDALLAHIEAQR